MSCLCMPMTGSQTFPLPASNDFLTLNSVVRLTRIIRKDPKSRTRCDASIKIRSNYAIYCDFLKSGSCRLSSLTQEPFHKWD